MSSLTRHHPQPVREVRLTVVRLDRLQRDVHDPAHGWVAPTTGAPEPSEYAVHRRSRLPYEGWGRSPSSPQLAREEWRVDPSQRTHAHPTGPAFE